MWLALRRVTCSSARVFACLSVKPFPLGVKRNDECRRRRPQPWSDHRNPTGAGRGPSGGPSLMWQNRDDDDDDLFHMVRERALEEMSQHLRRWIKLARTLGKMRSE